MNAPATLSPPVPAAPSAPAQRTALAIGFAIVVGTVCLLATTCLTLPQAQRALARALPRIHEDLFNLALLNPVFYAGCALILVLERFFPARRKQPVFSVGLAQDFVWLFLESVIRVAVLVTYAAWLRELFRSRLSFLVIDAVAGLPTWLKMVLGVVVIDLLGYAHHAVRHKVVVLWHFHTVHHSQRELNLFTDVRYHAVEYAVAHTVRFLPLMMLGLSSPPIVAYGLAHQWYTRFCHANIRTNLGPLRFLLVTPQSHRVHHSRHRRHWDQNYGVIFSVWDRLLGTHYRNDREYPKTGIPDERFPHERSAALLPLLATPALQLAYPFQSVWRALQRR